MNQKQKCTPSALISLIENLRSKTAFDLVLTALLSGDRMAATMTSHELSEILQDISAAVERIECEMSINGSANRLLDEAEVILREVVSIEEFISLFDNGEVVRCIQDIVKALQDVTDCHRRCEEDHGFL